MDHRKKFGQELKNSLDTYIDGWKQDPLKLFPTSRTLRRWIKGFIPPPNSWEEFLESATNINKDFPQEALQDLYDLAKIEIATSSELDEIMGADAYHFRFDEWCSEATTEICILQNWMSYVPKFPENLIKAVKSRSIPTRILLLSPDSAYVDRRYEERKRSKIEYLGYLEDLYKTIIENDLHLAESFQLRFYDARPPFAAYIVDDHVMLAQLWYRHATSTGPHLVLDQSLRYGTFIVQNFDNLWDITRPLQLTDFFEQHRKRLLQEICSNQESHM